MRKTTKAMVANAIAQPTQVHANTSGTRDLLLILAPSFIVFSMSNVCNSPFFGSNFFSYSNGCKSPFSSVLLFSVGLSIERRITDSSLDFSMFGVFIEPT